MTPPLIRPTRAIIHLRHLSTNLRYAQSLCRPSRLCAVIKANAYGHGIGPIGQFLQQADEVDTLGVALVEEGIALRQHGVCKPILVWGEAFGDDFTPLVTHQLTPVLGSESQLQLAHQAAIAFGKPLSVQLEVDTGMHRLGFPYQQIDNILRKLADYPGLRCTGLMSHFASADRNSAQNAQQCAQMAALAQLCDIYPNLLLHCANSAATLALPHTRYNMVRCGLLLFGYSPMLAPTTLPVQPILTWESSIISLRDLQCGDAVSYGGHFVAKRRMRIATVAVGYADGYPFRLSGHGEVLCRGQRAKLVGNVCMDLCMVDVTAIPQARVGDTVTLLGNDDFGQSIALTELAAWAQTLHYEILTNIGARVPRIYVT